MTNKLTNLKSVPILFLGLGVTQLFLLIFRMRSDYSEALYWDEWDSRLSMDVPVNTLNWEIFWQQHNEHRLVISKLFFTLDFIYFRGSNLPLLILNLVLSVLTILVVFKLLNLNSSNIPMNSIMAILYSFTIFSFSILQIENFSWGFQIQFFMSVLFPLLSFYFYLCYVFKNSKLYIGLSYLMCIVSIGTMASGNFAIIVIILGSVYLRRKVLEIFSHISLATILFLAYTHNYISANSSPLATIIQHPDFILSYIIVYFTSPFNQLTYNQIPEIAGAFTLFVFFVTIKNVIKMYRHRNNDVLGLAGLFLLLYSLLVALASAGGRYDFGVGQAAASRYSTISLLGWFGAFLLILHSHEQGFMARKFTWTKMSLVVSMIFLPFQIINSNTNTDIKPARKLAAIALLQNIKDESVSIALYPSGERLQNLSKSLILAEKSIFTADFKRRFAPKSLPLIEINSKPTCFGFVDTIRQNSDTGSFLITGWVATESGNSYTLDLLAINAGGKVVGAGTSGFKRQDVSDQLGSWSQRTGFQVVAKSSPRFLVASQNSNIECKFKIER